MTRFWLSRTYGSKVCQIAAHITKSALAFVHYYPSKSLLLGITQFLRSQNLAQEVVYGNKRQLVLDTYTGNL